MRQVLGLLAVVAVIATAWVLWLRRPRARTLRPHIGNRLSTRAAMPSYEALVGAYAALLEKHGLPTTIQWVFQEDWTRCRRPDGVDGCAIFPRPVAEGERIARLALERLRFHRPLALAAYAVDGDRVLVGLQADLFAADEVYDTSWDIHLDVTGLADLRDRISVVTDRTRWERLRADAPLFRCELDYAIAAAGVLADNPAGSPVRMG